MLPEIAPTIYRRQIWKPARLGTDAQLIIERMSPKRVHIVFERQQSESTPGASIVVRCVPEEEDATPTTDLSVQDGFQGSISTSERLDQGESVVFEVRIGKQKLLSPTYTP